MASFYPQHVQTAQGYNLMHDARMAEAAADISDWNIIVTESTRAASCFTRAGNVQTDFDLCQGTGYICLNPGDYQMDQIPLNGEPGFGDKGNYEMKYFNGYLKFSKMFKWAQEDLNCTISNPIGQAILQARVAELQQKALNTVNTRAYYFLMSQVKACNKGGYANDGDPNLGAIDNPFELSWDNSHCLITSVAETIRGFECGQILQCVGGSNINQGGSWMILPKKFYTAIKSNPLYSSYANNGEIVSGVNFMSNYPFTPEGIDIMFDSCVEPIISYNSAGEPIEVYPVLFGKSTDNISIRYKLMTNEWDENRTDSHIEKTNLYLQMEAPCTDSIGLAYITKPKDRTCQPCTGIC